MICVVETWLTPSISDAELSSNGTYSVFRLDREGGESRGGGVLMLVKKGIPCVQVEIPSDGYPTEMLCVDIICDKKVRLVTVYSAGTADAALENSAMESLCHKLESACITDCSVVIVSDMNCPNIDWPNKCSTGAARRERTFLDFVVLNSLSQLVKETTRPASGTVIDILLCSDECKEDIDVEVMNCPFESDHRGFLFKHNIAHETRTEPVEYDFERGDYDSIINSLLATNWNNVFEDTVSMDSMYNGFFEFLHYLVEINVPLRSSRKKKSIEQCVSRLHKQIEMCDSLNLQEMNRLQNQLTKVLERKRTMLEHSIVHSGNMARFYGYAASRLKIRDDLAALVSPSGEKVVEDEAKANLLRDVFQETYVTQSDNSQNAVLQPAHISTVADIDLSEEKVYRAIQCMKPKTSLSPEMLPAVFFKRAAVGLAKPLSLIYRRSVDEGKVPEMYRNAWVAPIHKGGSRSDPLNRRPVSLTPVSCKILERIISDTIMDNAESHGVVSEYQFAYRKGRSTTDCLLKFFNEIGVWINSSTPVDVVYCDFKSAFESMHHELLLSVLPSKGVGPKIKNWISDFLRQRSFRVKVHDTLSSAGQATTGCPQGTVLGSLLFLLFIDEIKHIIPQGVRYMIYADDVKLYAPVKSDGDRCLLQNTLNDLSIWAQRMGLRLSAHKCGVVHLGSNNPKYEYTLMNQPLAEFTEVKDLGVRFSATLNFSEQVAHVVAKGSMLCNWLLRAFAIKSVSSYLKLYNAYVLPLLLYACQVWSPLREGDWQLLEKMQRRFVRTICHRCGIESTKDLLPNVKDLLKTADVKMLRRQIQNEDVFNDFFDLEGTNSRTGFVIRAKARARTNKVANFYPWRVVRQMNNR